MKSQLRQIYFFSLGYIHNHFLWCIALLLADSLLLSVIVQKIKYTEIDWSTYLQQVAMVFDKGVRDYSKVYGDSGRLVYPAGFLYVFWMIRALCGVGEGAVRAGQLLFSALYLLNLVAVFRLYHKSGIKSPIPFALLILSRRIHSIYVLRMFNDCVAMLVLHFSFLFLLKQRYRIASIVYSLSVSIKMNTLLFGPAFGLILWLSTGFKEAAFCVLLMVLAQILIGMPFLRSHPIEYIRGSFDFGRQFLYKWTVNWRFIPKSVFENSTFSIVLLCLHVLVLAAWIYFRLARYRKQKAKISSPDLYGLLAECNLVGIIFARSLHYQFYSWYFHTIPLLLWRGFANRVPLMLRLAIFFGIEICWNVFPSTKMSSLVLALLNLTLLLLSVIPEA